MTDPTPLAGPSNPSLAKDAPPPSAAAAAADELSNRKKKRDAWQNRKVAKLLANGDLPGSAPPAPAPPAPSAAPGATAEPSASDSAATDAPQPSKDKVISKQALKRNKRRQDKKARIATGAGDEAALLADKEKLRLKHVAFKAKKAEAKKAEKAEKAKEKAIKSESWDVHPVPRRFGFADGVVPGG